MPRNRPRVMSLTSTDLELVRDDGTSAGTRLSVCASMFPCRRAPSSPAPTSSSPPAKPTASRRSLPQR
jgi:hypothetical protein